MIVIDNTAFNTTVLDICQVLREELRKNGINLLGVVKDTYNNVMISCPYHKDGQERRPSCGIHKDTGVVHCFTCGETHSLPDMIGYCFGKSESESYIFGIQWLFLKFNPIEIEEREFKKIDCSRDVTEEEEFISDSELDLYRYTHPYMYKRKLTDDIINMFDVGFDSNTQCITFPVRDINGNTLFVARRSVNTKYFNYPSGAKKPLYGIYEYAKYSESKELWVTESIINCLTCWTHGIPAVALNGTGSHSQYELLNKLDVRSLVLALDPDDAGKNGMDKIIKNCHNKLLYTVDYIDGRDINDLSSDEFKSLEKTKHFIFNGLTR